MAKEEKYLLVDERVVPDIFKKVLEAKKYLATGKAKIPRKRCGLPIFPAVLFINIKTGLWNIIPAAPTPLSPSI